MHFLTLRQILHWSHETCSTQDTVFTGKLNSQKFQLKYLIKINSKFGIFNIMTESKKPLSTQILSTI